MNIGLAKITVQNSFCDSCIASIKKRLKEVLHIKNVHLCSMSSTVMFSFTNANQISKVLNTLTDLGYPEQGDQNTTGNFTPPFCNCHEQKLNLIKAS